MKINKTIKYEEMNIYEKKIVEVLHTNYKYILEDAIEIMERYYPVMERLGWYESPEEWADNLNHIVKEKKMTPEQWNEFINKFKPVKSIKPLDPKSFSTTLEEKLARSVLPLSEAKIYRTVEGKFVPLVETDLKEDLGSRVIRWRRAEEQKTL